jgi:hypothetical protein
MDDSASYTELYDQEFFEGLKEFVEPSVAALVPAIVQAFSPSTVLDLGCGDGAWTVGFASHGVRAHGVDIAQVDRPLHPLATFACADLTCMAISDVPRVDLCLCIEVAEHLPASAAGHLVNLAVRASDVIVFSAATPGQWGTGHINEQPHSYWIERFAACGRTADEEWRNQIAHDERIAPWYRANLIVFRR